MTHTCVDAGVLIAAATSRQPLVRPTAIAILDDPNRIFVSSAFVRLEVVPTAVYQHNHDEVAFYVAFFASVTVWADLGHEQAILAAAEAARHGLSAMDALHVAAAARLGAAELVTTERDGRPIHRVTGVTVVSLHPHVSAAA